MVMNLELAAQGRSGVKERLDVAFSALLWVTRGWCHRLDLRILEIFSNISDSEVL